MVDHGVFNIISRKDLPRHHKIVNTTCAMKQQANGVTSSTHSWRVSNMHPDKIATMMLMLAHIVALSLQAT
jgi:hypothetical protein